MSCNLSLLKSSFRVSSESLPGTMTLAKCSAKGELQSSHRTDFMIVPSIYCQGLAGSSIACILFVQGSPGDNLIKGVLSDPMDFFTVCNVVVWSLDVIILFRAFFVRLFFFDWLIHCWIGQLLLFCWLIAVFKDPFLPLDLEFSTEPPYDLSVLPYRTNIVISATDFWDLVIFLICLPISDFGLTLCLDCLTLFALSPVPRTFE